MGVAEGPLVPLVDAGLGNSAYLVDLGDGRALAVDPSRDLRALRVAAERRHLRVAFAADTHLHADFLSGAVQLAHDDGATVFAAAAGRRGFPHVGLGDGDEVDLGGLTLRALATPGHTDEHLSYVVVDGQRELGVFTGGSLIVGSAARTDLLGAERTEELARAQYRSLHRLATLPDATNVWPTHGAGSFCSAPPGAERTSTIGTEKATNTLLAAPDEDAFVAQLLESLGSYPSYFDRLAEVNRRGPAVLARPQTLPPLSPATVARMLGEGARLVDVRPVREFAAGHVPAALSIPLRDQFASWLGWLVDDEVPLVFVLGDSQDPGELVWQALKIGYERLAGHLDGGVETWRSEGRLLGTVELVTAREVGRRPVLDVRQLTEYDAGHVPGAIHAELGDLPSRGSELARELPADVVVMCGHGERAMTGASLLAGTSASSGGPAVLVGGPDEWAKSTGSALVHGT